MRLVATAWSEGLAAHVDASDIEADPVAALWSLVDVLMAEVDRIDRVLATGTSRLHRPERLVTRGVRACKLLAQLRLDIDQLERESRTSRQVAEPRGQVVPVPVPRRYGNGNI